MKFDELNHLLIFSFRLISELFLILKFGRSTVRNLNKYERKILVYRFDVVSLVHCGDFYGKNYKKKLTQSFLMVLSVIPVAKNIYS